RQAASTAAIRALPECHVFAVINFHLRIRVKKPKTGTPNWPFQAWSKVIAACNISFLTCARDSATALLICKGLFPEASFILTNIKFAVFDLTQVKINSKPQLQCFD
ncbi:hypothetical protein, partial [uncultured Ottowia sp.]|uniref:hypothetical protein n=1 Tax=uncultured Ottowia sp. TaxID=543067 RepID=UPI00259A4E5F